LIIFVCYIVGILVVLKLIPQKQRMGPRLWQWWKNMSRKN